MFNFNREKLIELYVNCKKHRAEDFFSYYKQSIINYYINTS